MLWTNKMISNQEWLKKARKSKRTTIPPKIFCLLWKSHIWSLLRECFKIINKFPKSLALYNKISQWPCRITKVYIAIHSFAPTGKKCFKKECFTGLFSFLAPILLKRKNILKKLVFSKLPTHAENSKKSIDRYLQQNIIFMLFYIICLRS